MKIGLPESAFTTLRKTADIARKENIVIVFRPDGRWEVRAAPEFGEEYWKAQRDTDIVRLMEDEKPAKKRAAMKGRDWHEEVLE